MLIVYGRGLQFPTGLRQQLAVLSLNHMPTLLFAMAWRQCFRRVPPLLFFNCAASLSMIIT